MSNHLIDVQPPNPNSIKTGAATTLTVDYESDDGGAIQIQCGGGFDISPASFPVTASPSARVVFPVTITRGNATTKNCWLIVKFYHSSRELPVEVT